MKKDVAWPEQVPRPTRKCFLLAITGPRPIRRAWIGSISCEKKLRFLRLEPQKKGWEKASAGAGLWQENVLQHVWFHCCPIVVLSTSHAACDLSLLHEPSWS